MDELRGQRSYGSATCELSLPRAIPTHMRSKVRELSKLYTPEEDRCKGYASQLLHDICREADDAGMILMLSVADNDAQHLTLFYSRFGFQPIQAKPILMARMCGATPRTLNPIAKAIH